MPVKTSISQKVFFEGFLEDFEVMDNLMAGGAPRPSVPGTIFSSATRENVVVPIFSDYLRNGNSMPRYLIDLYRMDTEKPQEMVEKLAEAAGVEL